MLNFLGPLISGGLSLVGGLLGNQHKSEGQQREIENQKEFAQNGIRWRVEDATRAGVHPNVALGAQGAQYVPVGLGDNDTAASFSAAGQDVARAVEATRTSPERASAYATATENLTLERMGLENELLRTQIRGARQPLGPPFPVSSGDYNMPGQSGSGLNIFGNQVRRSNTDDAQVVEDRYGDFVELPYGVGVLISDLIHNAPKGTKGTRSVFGDRSKMTEYKTGGGF